MNLQPPRDYNIRYDGQLREYNTNALGAVLSELGFLRLSRMLTIKLPGEKANDNKIVLTLEDAKKILETMKNKEETFKNKYAGNPKLLESFNHLKKEAEWIIHAVEYPKQAMQKLKTAMNLTDEYPQVSVANSNIGIFDLKDANGTEISGQPLNYGKYKISIKIPGNQNPEEILNKIKITWGEYGKWEIKEERYGSLLVVTIKPFPEN